MWSTGLGNPTRKTRSGGSNLSLSSAPALEICPLIMNRHLANSIYNPHQKSISKFAHATRRISIALSLAVAGLNLFWVQPAQAAKINVPVAPSNVAAAAVSSSQINPSWQDNSSNETGFKIQRGPTSTGPWSQIATVGAGGTAYADTGLIGATTYYYQVCAYNSRGSSSYAGPVSATTLPPAAPS